MTLKWMLASAVGLCLVLSVQSARAASACPNPELGETATDCPWAGLSRDLSEAATQGGDLEKLLKKQAPSFYSQLRGVRRHGDWHSHWGWSINFDELAKGTIVDPAILKTLYSLTSVLPPPAALGFPENIQHAGLEHTYGYLFSVLKTSFGYKRARWVQGEIERGFGLTEAQLSPNPKKGSLLSNVTYFIGRIAFRNEPAAGATLLSHRERVDKELANFKFAELKGGRLEEKLVLTDGRTVTLRTDLIRFPKGGVPGGNEQLLIYSYLDSNDLGPKLITAFPVAAAFAAGIKTNLGEDQPIMTRYNAYVPSITGKPQLKGIRAWTDGVFGSQAAK